MLTGKPPYVGTLNQVISGHLHGEPAFTVSLNGHKTSLPEPTVSLLKALLAKDPAVRPRSGREVADLCQIRLQSVQTGVLPGRKYDGQRDVSGLSDSSTFHRLGQFMERNLGSKVSEYQGRRVLHTSGKERVIIWVLALVFLMGCLFAYLSSK
jgi:hypothetical protein